MGELIAAVRNQGGIGKPLINGLRVAAGRYVRAVDVVPWLQPQKAEKPRALTPAEEIARDKAATGHLR